MTSTDPVRKVSRRKEATWLGQRGYSQTFHLDSRDAGHRINVHGWLEDGKQGKAGDVTIKRIKGDFFRAPEKAERFDEVTLTDPSDEQIAVVIQRMAQEGALA